MNKREARVKARGGSSFVTASLGPKRTGRSKGRRVWIHSYGGNVSIYPEDARKFALELLKIADLAEKD